MRKLKFISYLCLVILCSTPIQAEQGFELWKKQFAQEAVHQNVSLDVIENYVPQMVYLPQVIELDRKQPEFKLSFSNYIKRMVTAERVHKGQRLLKEKNEILSKVQAKYGVPPAYLLAFWGLETNFGQTKGKTDVLSALATLSYDERRSSFFTEQLIAALKILQKEKVNSPKGSWAGAFGHFQFMPTTFFQYAVDADGDGQRDIVNSFPDALASAANYLSRMGWNKNLIWGREVELPPDFWNTTFDKTETYPLSFWKEQGILRMDGKEYQPDELNILAHLVLPSGSKGPVFLVYRNFEVIKRWNRSDFYALAIGILADKIAGKETSDIDSFETEDNLYKNDIIHAQEKLKNMGFYQGSIDGQFGSGTKKALLAYQKKYHLPQDGFLSKEVLEKILK